MPSRKNKSRLPPKPKKEIRKFSPVDVAKVIQSSAGLDRQKWNNLVLVLNIKPEVGERLANLYTNEGRLKALTETLAQWKSEQGKVATIENLVCHLTTMGWIDAKEKIETYFKLLCHEDMSVQEHLETREQASPLLASSSQSVDILSKKDTLQRHFQENLSFYLALCITVILLAIFTFVGIWLWRSGYFSKTSIATKTEISPIEQDSDADLIQLCETTVTIGDSHYIYANISVEDPKKCPPNAKVNQANQIKELKVSGALTPPILDNILRQATSVDKLAISNSNNAFCKKIIEDKSSSLVLLEMVNTNQIRSVELLKFSNCNELYKLFCSHLKFHQLRSLRISGSDITDANVNCILEMLQNTKRTLNALHVHGNWLISKTFYSPFRQLPAVSNVTLDLVHSLKNATRARFNIFDNTFCWLVPNLRRFESSAISYPDFLIVLKCRKLIYLNVTVLVRKNDTLWDLNGSITKSNLDLRLQIKFFNHCGTKYQLDRLGLGEKATKLINVEIINPYCSNSDEDSSSEIVNYQSIRKKFRNHSKGTIRANRL